MGKFFVCLLILIGCQFWAAYCIEINPEEVYCWYSGMGHGTYAIANWFISLFAEGRLIKASLCTTAYTVWWWISLCFSVVWNIIAVALLLVWCED